MVIDRQNCFAPPGAPASIVGASGANILLTDQIDLRANRDISEGHPLFWFVQVTTPLVGNSETFELVVADDAAITVNVEVIASIGPFTVAQINSVGRWGVPVPPTHLQRVGRRFLAARARASGAALTAGAVVSGIVEMIDTGAFTIYPAVQPFV